MLGFLLAPENIAFATALVLMLLIGLVEIIGLGADAIQLEADADAFGHDFLGWLGVGRLPLLMLIVVALASFGIAGLLMQQAMIAITGQFLPAALAIPAAAVAALPVTSVLGRGLAHVMPRDETTAVGIDTLVGRRAHIVVGTATAGSPARARTYDIHGQSHYVLVEPTGPDERFAEGDEILLVRRDADGFKAVAVTPRAVTDLGVL